MNRTAAVVGSGPAEPGATRAGRTRFRSSREDGEHGKRLASATSRRWTQLPRNDAAASCGWYTDTLVSTVCLAEAALLVEERRVVAVTGSLAQLRVPIEAFRATAAMEPAAVTARSIYGGDLIDEPDARPARRLVRIRLPTTLHSGQSHQYGLVLTARGPASRIDQHVHVCTHRCDLFIARVRFESGFRPDRVWLVDGVPPEDLPVAAVRGRTIPVDSVGEVAAHFRELEPGRCYGFGWQPTEPVT